MRYLWLLVAFAAPPLATQSIPVLERASYHRIVDRK
jgi:hypothetical protein